MNMKKFDYRVGEVLSTFIGMILGVVIMFQGKLAPISMVLIFWIVVGALAYLYHRNKMYGTWAVVVGIGACLGLLGYVWYFGGFISAIFLLCLPMIGSVALYGGGMIGFQVAEGIRFLKHKVRSAV